MDREHKPHGKVIKDSLPIDAPLISQVSVNLDVLPVHAAVNHFRPGKLRRETVQPRGAFCFPNHDRAGGVRVVGRLRAVASR